MNYVAGMSRETGELLGFDEHLRQSIFDILMTPLGSRLIRRDYGSLLPFLLDSPVNSTTKIKMMAAIATALIKWEPRVKVRTVQLFLGNDGKNHTGNHGISINLVLHRADNQLFNTSLSLVRGAS